MNIVASDNRSLTRLQLLSRFIAADAADTVDRLLTELGRTLELVEIGMHWPVPGPARVFARIGRPGEDSPLVWSEEIVARINAASACEDVFFHPCEQRRLMMPVVVEGRRNGLLWAIGSKALSEEEQQVLSLCTRCLTRHPAFADKLGPLNDQARIAQRLHDASMVAGKIAHDFDNIFTGVVGFAEMVQDMLAPDSLARQYVGEIMSAGNRGIAFTQQLHQMSRSGATRPAPTSVSSVLQREEARLKKTPGLNVKLQFAAPTDLPPVAMDGAALQQSLGHILDNAVEASPAGGAVRVSAALIELSEAEAADYFGAASAGPFVELRIADEGPGIREDQRRRLFVEPFFTTKVRHRGLGLPVALRILHAHRGGIRHVPGPSRGSVFHVVLPLAAARASETGSTPLDTNRTPGGNAS